MALNKACADEIDKFCEDDGGFFSEGTAGCVSHWSRNEDLSPKCKSVVQWAVPGYVEGGGQAEEEGEDEEGEEDGEEGAGPGMTEAEKREKEEWRAERKKGRDSAMGKMKVDQAELDKLQWQKENPEEFQRMKELEEEERKQKNEIRRRERIMAAAAERKRREESGEVEDDGPKAPKDKTTKKKKTSWTSTLMWLGVVVAIGALFYFGATSGSFSASQKGSRQKKKRN